MVARASAAAKPELGDGKGGARWKDYPRAGLRGFFFFTFIFLNLLGEICMCIPNQNYLMDALDTVLTWNLSDESLPLALINQAQLLSGLDAEESWQDFTEVSH